MKGILAVAATMAVVSLMVIAFVLSVDRYAEMTRHEVRPQWQINQYLEN